MLRYNATTQYSSRNSIQNWEAKLKLYYFFRFMHYSNDSVHSTLLCNVVKHRIVLQYIVSFIHEICNSRIIVTTDLQREKKIVTRFYIDVPFLAGLIWTISKVVFIVVAICNSNVITKLSHATIPYLFLALVNKIRSKKRVWVDERCCLYGSNSIDLKILNKFLSKDFLQFLIERYNLRYKTILMLVAVLFGYIIHQLWRGSII